MQLKSSNKYKDSYQMLNLVLLVCAEESNVCINDHQGNFEITMFKDLGLKLTFSSVESQILIWFV